MPVREMTPDEVEELFGNGLIIFGQPKPGPTARRPGAADVAPKVDPAGPLVLLERERSGFCSTFTEYLCLERVGPDEWQLGAYQHNLVSVEDIPQEVLFPDFVPEDEDDEPDWLDVELPVTWNGVSLIDSVDDGFLTDELLLMDKGVKFDKTSTTKARQYCREKQWHLENDFESAWQDLLRLIGVGA